ncbi:MAG: desulfoferrodoxin [Desulfovibrio sp.]|jgi:superoxide reductase|nr:desulfoferrodoxin [Desulfovibrio sp.]
MTTAYTEIYKCERCCNIVEVLHGGGAPLSCCGQAMTPVLAGAVDAAREKHVPVIEKTDGGYKVSVGSVTHPMEEKHSIEWIELLADNRNCLRMLKPGQTPEAFFPIDAAAVTARAYCNLHGLWKADS